MSFQLEICCYNLQSALIAQKAGAHRIELCADPGKGGTTPSAGVIREVRKKIQIKLYPIIRPRGGDFLISIDEFEIMKDDIIFCKQTGCDGIATGILLKNGQIDKEKCARLVELAYPMEVTFHRAFDRVLDPFKALGEIIDVGCERILTSGLQPRAVEGESIIRELIVKAEDRIIIMPGSGVRASNILQLAINTGAFEFHSSARIHTKSEMEYKNPSLQDEFLLPVPDQLEIESMLMQLKEISSQTKRD